MSRRGSVVRPHRHAIGAAVIVLLVECSRAWAAPATSEPAPSARTSDGTEVESTAIEIDEAGLADVDLGNLIALDEVSVASMNATQVREAPGIVSVLTREDIEASGARDLVDLLEMVPGFFIGVDVQGNLGIGIRGNWGQEGKILILIDGQEINETAYGTVSIAHHFPVQAIERIEIIRGPGSAIYGGFAELGVVKISTRDGEDIEGVETLQRAGLAAGKAGVDTSHPFVDTYVASGRTYGDFDLSLSLFGGYSVQSEGTYTDIFGTSYAIADTAVRRPLLANFRLTWRDWRLLFIADGFTYQAQDDFDIAGSASTHYRFGGIYSELSNIFQLGRDLTLTPRLNYKIQNSYATTATSAADEQRIVDAQLLSRLRMDRALAGATLQWKPRTALTVMAGSEAFSDVGRAGGTPGDGSSVQGTNGLWTVAGFGQLLWSNAIANLTLGGRAEYASQFGWSTVPRLALTHVFASGLHAKLLASRAHKSPTFMNYTLERTIDPSNQVRAERTDVLEAEIGYLLPSGLQLAINGFLGVIENPIIYTYEPKTGLESYFNRGRTGTFGGEAEARWTGKTASLDCTYAYYHALSGLPEDYRVGGGGGATLGAPQHKAVFRGSWRPMRQWRHWLLGGTAIVFGKRYATTGFNNSDQSYVITSLAPRLLLGLSVRYKDLGLRGLLVGLTVNDLLDSRDVYAQPYLGGHAPLPGVGRQVMLSLGYGWER